MYFDPSRNAYIDKDTGEVVYYEENNSSRNNQYQGGGTYVIPPSTLNTHQNDNLENFSNLEIELMNMQEHFQPPTINSSSSIVNAFDKVKKIFKIDQKNKHMRILTENYDDVTGTNSSSSNGEATVASSPLAVIESGGETNQTNNNIPNDGPNQDWKLANLLQTLEFEIAENNYHRENYHDFESKEISASNSIKRQLLTFSALICLVQIILLICMVETDGFASSKENSSMGPPAYALVRYGAKESALIVYKTEIWRLFSSLFLHAGIFHLIPNVVIQLRVGGYLNLIFGIFGSMMSCLFIPNSVGVGSSGALLGLLCSWVVWIVSRWNLIPKECHGQRNCQLTIVVVSIVVTFATSFMPNVDWSAHFGGGIMGFLLGIILLLKKGQRKFNFDNFLNSNIGTSSRRNENLENGVPQAGDEDIDPNNLNNILLEIIDEDLSEEEKRKWKQRDLIIDVLQKISYFLVFSFYFIGILCLALFLKPSKINMEYWNENDDW